MKRDVRIKKMFEVNRSS